jgi:copper chaperone NosL
MNYQPPLVGYKQLLNFTAGSVPDTGGVLVGIAGTLAALAVIKKPRSLNKRNEKDLRINRTGRIVA